MSELTRAEFLNDVIRVTNQDYEAVRRIKDSDAALRTRLDEVAQVRDEHYAAYIEATESEERLRGERDAAQARVKELEARLEAFRGHLTFFGATRLDTGEIELNMKKYHAAHRCEVHRVEPWQGIDSAIDCIVCLKQQLDTSQARTKELEKESGGRLLACLDLIAQLKGQEGSLGNGTQPSASAASQDALALTARLAQMEDMANAREAFYASELNAAEELRCAQRERITQMEGVMKHVASMAGKDWLEGQLLLAKALLTPAVEKESP